MTKVSEIPLIPARAQKFNITLRGINYTFDLNWNRIAKYWVLNILLPSEERALLCGLPLITGADLLAQFEYMGIGGQFIVKSIAVGKAHDEVPTFDNLGTDGFLFFVEEP